MHIRSVVELFQIAGKRAAQELPVEKGFLLPFPRSGEDCLEAWCLYYDVYGPPQARRVDRVTHLARLDATSGEVLAFGAVRQEEIGIDGSVDALPPAAALLRMDGMVYADKWDHLLDISRPLWRAFGTLPATDFVPVKHAKDYLQTFVEIVPPTLLPFYAPARPYFDYLGWAAQQPGG